MHNDAVDQNPKNPCRRHACHLCCLETRMTLTEADADRLRRAGFEDFARITPDGDLELTNRDGACVFLDRGACRVYGLRPEGCRFYPLVLDLDLGGVIRDERCPHRDEFPVDAGVAAELRRSVATEEAEAARRRTHG